MAEKAVGTREWYDFVAGLADIMPMLHVGGAKATQRLLEMCQIKATDRVLDVGCGNGTTACWIVQHYGCQVQGVDISEGMVARAKQRAQHEGLTDRTEFRVADALHLPFDDGTFDLAIFESFLTPLPGDPRAALSEMVRVLGGAGSVGANEGTFDPAVPPEFWSAAAEHPAINHCFTPEQLRELFEGVGLRVLQLEVGKPAPTPNVLKTVGLHGLLSFMLKSYPRMVAKLRDPRFRVVKSADDKIGKWMTQYAGYALIVGEKPAG